MRKPRRVVCQTIVFASLFLLALAEAGFALERQPNADYHARREALAKKSPEE